MSSVWVLKLQTASEVKLAARHIVEAERRSEPENQTWR